MRRLRRAAAAIRRRWRWRWRRRRRRRGGRRGGGPDNLAKPNERTLQINLAVGGWRLHSAASRPLSPSAAPHGRKYKVSMVRVSVSSSSSVIRCVSTLAECRVRVHVCKELYSYALLNREVPYPLSRGKPRAILLYFIEDLKRKEAASILYRKAVGFLGPAHIAGDPDGSRLNCSFLHFRGTCSSHQGAHHRSAAPSVCVSQTCVCKRRGWTATPCGFKGPK